MHTFNQQLEKKILEADGQYLDARGLEPLERYLQTYSTRLATYQQLRDLSDKLVLQALRHLAQTYPELIQSHGQRCKYDMTEVLRYVALSILRDDEVFFKEQMMSWLDTILMAHKKTTHCTAAYRYLQDAINSALPAISSGLTRSYLEMIITTLESHA
ncbi:phycobilisome protein [Leptolyngbya sp. 'hensonii']|uniref:phycobilisome protein n=1 Tax=Leptolyngbya sp. 'hensonii' TaxID=1922337 RepID=UPI00094F7260|nr:phycobilisome protein [Leptolyngbya sp. 'hensonii']OLP20244.1 phycobilisome protein [Leptolyngbya sp. 'hensonii']